MATPVPSSDFPPHSVPPPDSGLPNAGPLGKAFSDKIAAWQFVGEACVLDCTDLLDKAPRGRSPLIQKERVIAWEKSHRPLGPGDVVLFHSGYSLATTSRSRPAAASWPNRSAAKRRAGRTPIRSAWNTWPAEKS